MRYRLHEGAGEPVVLLHPWFGCAAFCDATVAGLPGRPRYVLDLYSAGAGYEGPEGLARAVLELLDAEGTEQAALVGNSTGGIAAQVVAIEAPERVSRLVLVGTGASTAGVSPAFHAELEAWLATGEGTRGLVRRLLARDPPELERYVEAVERADRPFMAATLERVLALDLRPRLSAITARTLVVRGSEDPARTPEHVRELLVGIRGSTAVEIAGGGHSPMVDSPERFVPLVRDFLA